MKINLGISPLANVLALVNEKNGSSLTDQQVTAGLAIVTDESPGDNTKVTLTGIAAQGYKDSATYFYGRYNLLDGVSPDPDRVLITSTDTQAQIRTKVASAFGLMESEIVVNENNDVTIPSSGNEIVTVNMSSKEGSLLYVPDTRALKVVASDVDIPLSVAIPNLTLPGFTGFTIDPTKTGPQNLLAMVNKANPIGLASSSVAPSGMTTYTPTDPDTSNTKLTLTGSAGTGFDGSVEIHYHRVSLASQQVPTPAYVEITADDTVATTKTKVAAALKIVKGAVIFTAQTQPTSGVDGTITVTPSATNYLYTGTALVIPLRLV